MPLPTRNSNGLEQFLASIQDRQDLTILDLAGANQNNIDFLTSLGHRLYSDDIVRGLDEAFGAENFLANQADPLLAQRFFEESLDFPPDSFDGALLWDTLQFLAPPLLQLTVDRLYHILRPGAYLLAFFNADEKCHTAPLCSYRIADRRTLTLAGRGQSRPVQFINNRGIEKLFQNFQSLKFFLTRDHLREVIVRR